MRNVARNDNIIDVSHIGSHGIADDGINVSTINEVRASGAGL